MWISFGIYIIGIALILFIKPVTMFNNETGKWKEFGLNRGGNSHTIFPFWMFALSWAFVSYSMATLATLFFTRVSMGALALGAIAADNIAKPISQYNAPNETNSNTNNTPNNAFNNAPNNAFNNAHNNAPNNAFNALAAPNAFNSPNNAPNNAFNNAPNNAFNNAPNNAFNNAPNAPNNVFNNAPNAPNNVFNNAPSNAPNTQTFNPYNSPIYMQQMPFDMQQNIIIPLQTLQTLLNSFRPPEIITTPVA